MSVEGGGGPPGGRPSAGGAGGPPGGRPSVGGAGGPPAGGAGGPPGGGDGEIDLVWSQGEEVLLVRLVSFNCLMSWV